MRVPSKGRSGGKVDAHLNRLASGCAEIVPLQVGVLQFPIPSAKRCYKLGQALRRAIESYPEDISVAVVATGALASVPPGAESTGSA